MLEYRPWSQVELSKSFEKYKKGVFSILDIELSGHCNFNCVYCDSPDHKKKCKIDIKNVEKIMSSCLFDWVFICGLGEPVFGSNYDFLIDILKLCKKYNVKCSIFSNASICTDEIIQYIEEGILHVLFKYDSRDLRLNANVYGTTNYRAKLQYANIQKLMKHVKYDNGTTNIGASIVPTRFNVDKIPDIIEECCKYNVYPLIADLENSGRGQEHFSALSLNNEEIQKLKESVEKIIGEEYRIPICPAVISGIHISYNSDIVVDGISGLSCPWFWLEEPKLHTVLELKLGTGLSEIKQSIVAYRNEKLSNVQELQSLYMGKDCENLTFGGCGGDIKLLLNKYIEIQRTLKEENNNDIFG